MTYQNMARKYRPQTFADVATQTHITETLRRALQADRVASAYLFTGPRGSGKTTVARLLAKAVNCDAPKKGEPCTKCESCKSITLGRSMDVLEIDGASNNSVDDIRELRENVRYAASEAGKRKVYIIDEVHMLSTGAFNALLKTLEEPPSHVLFVFATTEVRKVPATILSRCQRFDFRRLTTQEIHERLQLVARKEKKDSKLDVSTEALYVIAKRADGSLRDALSLLDQVQSSTQGRRIEEEQVAEVLGLVREEVYLDLTDAIAEHDAVRSLQVLHGALQQGADSGGFVLGLLEHLRNLLMLSVDESLQDTVQLGDAHMKRARELAGRFQTEDLLYLLNRSAAIHEEVRRSSNPVVLLESAMVELARFESRVLLQDVLDSLEGGDGGASAPKAGSSATRRTTTGGASRRRGVSGEPRASATTATDAALLSRPEIVAGGPPTLPGTPPTATMRPAAAPASARFGAPRVVTPTAAPPMADQEAPRDFERHLDEAFDADVSAAAPDVAETPRVTQFRGGTVDLAALQSHWQDFTEVVRGSKAMLAHCLSEGRPRSLHDGVLGIGFSEEHAFHLNLMRENRTQRELEKQIERFFGTRLKVSLVDAQSSGNPVQEPANTRLTPEDVAESRREAAQDALDRTPRLQEILDVFDGEILEDNQPGPGGA